MVEYNGAGLDRTFAALADPTRRALIARLRDEPDLSISELAQPHRVTLQAVIKHLSVLEGAGLVKRRKTGRTVRCRLTALPMADASHWLERYEQFWAASFDRLTTVIEDRHRRERANKTDGRS